MNKPTTTRFTEEDQELIEKWKKAIGAKHKIAAIRYTLRNCKFPTKK